MKAIVAVCNDFGIGKDGAQTIVIPEDRRRFKTLTCGGVLIAGRKTFEALQGPLPGRSHIVLTRNHNYAPQGATVAHYVADVLEAIEHVSPDKVFVIGGGDIYRLFLPLCDCAYVTKIDAAPPSDTFFPDLDNMSDWSVESRESKLWYTDKGITIRYSFDLYKNNATIAK
ncbi:MAG: dihydrofolate reductase [Oscillospiraceae bacterium]|nr:dihydrofolate reductase [Oscillospiraceae bacterium]